MVCAVLHEYRPSSDQTGGVAGKVDISLEMGPTGDLWVTWWTADPHRESPTSL